MSEAGLSAGGGRIVYLDWNATTPLHPLVLARMDAARGYAWANPASVHAAGRAARRVQEETREKLAELLSVHPRDVIWTGGGTEANHLALSGASSVITSAMEHPSVAKTAQQMQDAGIPVIWLPVPASGRLESEVLREAIGELRQRGALGKRPLACIQAANHETGVLQPIEEMAAICLDEAVHLHVDAVQLVGRGPLTALKRAGSVAIAAHKVRGPKGLGALCVRHCFTPLPVGRGGAQERGLRPGTLDAVALAGFGGALERLGESEQNYARLLPQLRSLEEQLIQGDAILHSRGLAAGAAVPSLSHVVNFRVPGWTGDELVAALDLEGICVSSGSACSAGTAEPSPGIEAMLGREAARGAVRVSLGEETSGEDLRLFVESLRRLRAIH